MSPELAHHLSTLDPVVLGARVKAARLAAGLTQPELAGTDASVAYLSRIESGQRRAGTDLLVVLAAKLGVTLDYLAHGEGWEDASRLELQLDHAELSLAGGEGANALALAREALGSPGLESVSGGVVRARYVEAAALNRLGDPAAVPAFQALLNEAPDTGIRLKVATSLCSIWREKGQFERAIACAQGQLSVLAPDLLATEEAIRLAVTLASVLFLSGRTEEAADICDQAISESERLSSPVARASAYWNASMIRSESGDVAGALPLAKRALHLLENTERVRDVGSLRTAVSSMLLRQDPPRLEDAQEQLRLADLELEWSHANPTERARNSVVNAQAQLLAGDIEACASRAYAVVEEFEGSLVSVEAQILMGQAAWAADDRDTAREWYRTAIATLTGIGADREAAQVWFELGTLAAQAGLVAESADAFQRAAASAGLTARLPVVAPATPPAHKPVAVPAGRLPVVGAPGESRPHSVPAPPPHSRS